MLYLAIDQHAKQITVCVRKEDGDPVASARATLPSGLMEYALRLERRKQRCLHRIRSTSRYWSAVLVQDCAWRTSRTSAAYLVAAK